MRSLRLLYTFLLPAVVAFGLYTATPLHAAEVSKAAKGIKTETLKKAEASKQPSSLDVMVDKSVPVSFKTPAASIFIANPDIADIQVISPTSIMVYGKKEGQTTLQVTDGAGHDLVYKTVTVSQNLAKLRESLRAILPNTDIQVESVPGGIILTGNVADAASVEDARRLALRYLPKDGDIINRVKVKANNQVEIRVRFAEVSRDVDKRFGFNWNNIATIGGTAFSLATGPVFSGAGTSALTRTVIGDGINDAIGITNSSRHVTINGMIDALEENGLVTILAEPSLTALSGQTASFLAGGEFPIPVPQSQSTITIEWKQYGVSLAFTPTILSDDRINLHVRPEVSQLSDIGAVTLYDIEIPALTTRRAETTIELGSGQSFALAGLLNSQQNKSVNKFPFLGDIPVLGPLFRSSRFQNNETELVIIITPYIVKPTTQENLSLPTDGLSHPTDTDMLFKLRDTNSNPEARAISGEPRAMKIEDPMVVDSPVPTAAPRAAVTYQSPEQISARPTPTMTSAPMSTPMPISKLKKPAPMGPGGFIVE